MKSFISKVVAAPLAVDDVMAGPLGNLAACMKQRGIRLCGNPWVGGRVAVVITQIAEWLRLKIIPTERLVRVKLEVFLGNVINKLFAIIKVWAPRYIPGNLQLAAGYLRGWPIGGRIPRGSTAVPSFAVEAANVGRGATFAADIVGQHTHKGVAAIRVIGKGFDTGGAGGFVCFFVKPTMGVACWRVYH